MKKLFLLIFMLNMHSFLCKEPKQVTRIKAVIFDTHGVLFEEDSIAFAKKIGIGAMSSYTISHWKNPVNTCLDILEHMSKDTQHAPKTKFTFKDRQMPHCIVEWQCGRKDYKEVAQTLQSYWNDLSQKNFFKSKKEREITECIMRTALDPNTFSDIAKPTHNIIKLARDLKKRGYQIYLAGNMPKEQYEIMLKNYPEIKDVFDAIHVSSTIGIIKPSSHMYTHIAQKHNIKCQECLVIDDEKAEIAAAKQAGMQTILFTSSKQSETQLKKLGII